jgi:hypothetical protein
MTARSQPRRTRVGAAADIPVAPAGVGGEATCTRATPDVVAKASAALGVLSRGPSRGTRAVLAAQTATRLENREAFSWTDRVLKPLEARQARTESESLLEPEGELLRGGGEIAQRPSPDSPWNATRASLIDTLEQPNMLAVEASEQRTADLQAVDILAAGLDAAVTAQASNSLEKMLCHQMAAAHHAAMHLLGKALGEQLGRALPPVELVRLTSGAARLMDVFQAAFVTLHRARTGGRQEVVVQHVHVAGGGQAVIAGTMKTKRHRGANPGEE